MSNTYESGAQKIIPAVLLYAFYQGKVLMIHRNLKINDHHQDKWNGLGGKLESPETFLDAAVREFEEESGVPTLARQWHWLGQLYFPNFKAHKKEDWWVNVLVIDFSSEQFAKFLTSDLVPSEGTLHWIENEEVLNLNLWDGDRHFIPYILKRTPFEGTLFYENGNCVRAEVKPLID